ncbi:hypothetical protein BN2475_280068 [Paraburkholderia ribeironis]|uniref:Uncharacterized protein n=1 Tax=Paraburkholderia ribeironis TaxID=1247936 RepID=A0A1N7S2J7_9BURK|nr:hypothetical protein BN2475_280068 [Paraburkholderia ribeironis]
MRDIPHSHAIQYAVTGSASPLLRFSVFQACYRLGSPCRQGFYGYVIGTFILEREATHG